MWFRQFVGWSLTYLSLSRDMSQKDMLSKSVHVILRLMCLYISREEIVLMLLKFSGILLYFICLNAIRFPSDHRSLNAKSKKGIFTVVSLTEWYMDSDYVQLLTVNIGIFFITVYHTNMTLICQFHFFVRDKSSSQFGTSIYHTSMF